MKSPSPTDTPPISHNSPQSLTWLIGAAIATVILWQVPFGRYVLYPFSILATWFHEMGHGLTAIAMGGTFKQLMLYPSGAGLAYHSGQLWFGPIGRALVSAGGLLGPSIAGMVLLWLSTRKLSRVQLGLFFLGLGLLASALIWVRTLFGVAIVIALGVAIAAIPLYAPRWMQYFAVQFLGVQACISSYQHLDYLFTERVSVGGRGLQYSDTGQIAQQLLLPYWFWGGLLALISLLFLGLGLRSVMRQSFKEVKD
ncbi:MAG: M50 family metallopeptidase [Cyanobacteria bacterium P01_F01_bin.153]